MTTVPATHATRTVALPDRRLLEFADFGDPSGRPVVALHSVAHAHPLWALADEAARRHGIRLIAPDRPGYARSTSQPDRRILDGPHDLLVLVEALGLSDFGVVTVAGGSVYGTAAAACLRTMVRRLALVAPEAREPTARAAFRLGAAVRTDPWGAARRLLADHPAADRRALAAPTRQATVVEALTLAFADPGAAALDARLRTLPWGRDRTALPKATRTWPGPPYSRMTEMAPIMAWLARG